MTENPAAPIPQLLTEIEVRKALNVSRTTMWRWRQNKTGPKAYHVGPRLMYAPSEIVAWLDSVASLPDKAA